MEQTDDSQKQTSRQRERYLSSYGKCRSFPKMPHLLQHVNNGSYYARIKANGKIIR